jgi:hypothetical protein
MSGQCQKHIRLLPKTCRGAAKKMAAKKMAAKKLSSQKVVQPRSWQPKQWQLLRRWQYAAKKMAIRCQEDGRHAQKMAATKKIADMHKRWQLPKR